MSVLMFVLTKLNLILSLIVCLYLPSVCLAAQKNHGNGSFELLELEIPDLQKLMESGTKSSTALTQLYLDRIDAIDRNGHQLRSVIEINPDAIAIATQMDQERKSKGSRGQLHGIPVLIKDNIDTADKMSTTAGSLALVGPAPDKDAFLVQKLRAAGAVILGKTNLSEWANIRSTNSTSGWSGRGGQTRNPYVLDRNPCGSSSGSGTAVSANLCSVAIGNQWFDRLPCIRLRHRRDQAHGWVDQSSRHYSDFIFSRYSRPDGSHGSRCGHLTIDPNWK
jgi:amidase